MGKSMRLPNSIGSVYPLSGNRRRPWAIAKTFGWDDNGKQIQKIIDYAESRAEGLSKLFEYNKNPLSNIELLNIKFKDVFDLWIKSVEQEGKMSESNLNAYKSVFNNHCSLIANTKILEIKTIDIQNCINNCNKGYNTKKYIKLIASQIYKYSIIQLDLPLTRNFRTGLMIGNYVKSQKHSIFTFNEISTLWKNIDIPFVDSILILMYTGLRPSELLKIEKAKIFLDQEYMIGGLKTKAGIDRKIPINDKIKPLIKKLMNENDKYLIEKNKSKVNYRHYLDIFKNIMSKLDMNHLPHDPRHTIATELDDIGTNDIIIKLILGHEIGDITKGVYTHKNIQQLIDAINQIRY